MASKSEARREDLKHKLIEAARAQIAENGLKGLRARDVTAGAGCALGSLYNIFEDLDMLILHVNSVTLHELDIKLGEASAAESAPEPKLKAMARAYMRFALDNRNLWAALFEHRFPDNRQVPQWHLDDHAVLFRHVIAPLAQLEPHLSQDELALRARTAFAAVHGIVAISIAERFVGLPREKLASELDRFTALLAAGQRATGGG